MGISDNGKWALLSMAVLQAGDKLPLTVIKEIPVT
jgi:hypothetical protein